MGAPGGRFLPPRQLPGGGESEIVSVAKEAGGASRKFERFANDYWTAEFCRRRQRRGGAAWAATVLGYRMRGEVTMVLVHDLGAVLSFASPSTPLAIGDEIEVAPTVTGELAVL